MRRVFAISLHDRPSRGSILDREEFVPIPHLIDTPLPKPIERVKKPEAKPTKSLQVATPAERVVTEGRFFRVGSQKFHPRGVTYGPF
jgi:hypothetical protein